MNLILSAMTIYLTIGQSANASYSTLSVVSGADHSCAKTSAGIQCWGGNRYGQSTPPPYLEEIRSVTVGHEFSCAIAKSKPVCWGNNKYGQTNPPPLLGVTKISAGYNHACAMSNSGVICWGDNSFGQTSVPKNLPRVLDVASGYEHTCVQLVSGVRCWGQNDLGQSTPPRGLRDIKALGSGDKGSCAIKKSGELVCWGWENDFPHLPNMDLSFPTHLKALSVFGKQVCVIKADDTAYCFGNYSNLGGYFVYPPTQIGLIKNVSAGERHACAIRNDGKVICWGTEIGNVGQVVPPDALTETTELEVGDRGACARSRNGQLICWGGGFAFTNLAKQTASVFSKPNESLCLVDSGSLKCFHRGTEYSVNIPAFEIADITALSTGGAFSCALASNGQIYCWFKDEFMDPNRHEALGHVTQISVGGHHACVVLKNGTVKCWVRIPNISQCTVGEADPPVGLKDIVSLSSGDWHTCALNRFGEVSCWGAAMDDRFVFGDCRDFRYQGQTIPPSDLKDVISISSGASHACALNSAGHVRCWGSNEFGQITPPTSLSGVKSISSGGNHTCAFTREGVQCWGSLSTWNPLTK